MKLILKPHFFSTFITYLQNRTKIEKINKIYREIDNRGYENMWLFSIEK